MALYMSRSFSDYLQITPPDDTLSRRAHSTTAITLCPGLVEVFVFGGTTDNFINNKPESSYSRVAETTILTFGEPWLAILFMCI